MFEIILVIGSIIYIQTPKEGQIVTHTIDLLTHTKHKHPHHGN